MKKNKLTILFLLSVLLFSCSKEASENRPTLTVDYVTDIGRFKDLTINTDNNVYAFSVNNNSGTENIELQQISPNGTNNKVFNSDAYSYNYPKITNDNFGKLYWTSGSLTAKINSFSDNFTPVTIYTMQGADQLNIGLYEFSNLTDDTYAIYDGNVRKFKLYSKNQNTDFVIAGSENYSILDGIGANAAFVWVSKIKTFNNAIYAVESNHYIRKIDCNTMDYTVSTIYNLYNEEILDFAIDANEDIYTIVQNKGIYKLTNGSYSIYKNGVETIKALNNNKSSTINWTKFTNIYIKNNDLYLVSGDYEKTLTKISNFKEKL